MFTPWLRLPTELKATVLGHAVQAGEPIDYNGHCRNLERNRYLGALIQTRNHQVALLSIARYYSLNTFALLVETHWHFESVSFKLRHPQGKCARMIQHLDISLDCSLSTIKPVSICFDMMHPWTFIFTTEDSPRAPTSSVMHFIDRALIAKRPKLWCDFNSLRTLEVSITATKELACWYSSVPYHNLNGALDGNSKCYCGDLPSLVQALGCARLDFKAKTCAITLDVPTCVSGECNAQLNAALEGAVSSSERN